MKFKKPGLHEKQKRPKLIPPNEKYCRHCFVETGTERFCHAESRLIKMKYGGGIMGSKILDDQTGWLCVECDIKLSKPLQKDASEEELQFHKRQWETAIELTWM